MSFGFSVGDLIGAANLTYRLIKALSGTQGAGVEFSQAIEELGCFQQALMRVSCLKSNDNVSQATFDSASCIVMSSVGLIESYLERTKKYDRGFAMGKGLAHSLRKVGWTLFKKSEMQELRDTLRARSVALGLLLSAAHLDVTGMAGKIVSERSEPVTQMSAVKEDAQPPELGTKKQEQSDSEDELRKPNHERVDSAVSSVDSGIDMLDSTADSDPKPPHDDEHPTSSQEMQRVQCTSYLETLSPQELVALISHQPARKAHMTDIAIALKELLIVGQDMLAPNHYSVLVTLLGLLSDDEEQAPGDALIKFEDSIGRKFLFPWHLVSTWKGMQEMIRQAFFNVNTPIRPQVLDRRYDLVGPDGIVMVPSAWESLIKPQMTICMHMWDGPAPMLRVSASKASRKALGKRTKGTAKASAKKPHQPRTRTVPPHTDPAPLRAGPGKAPPSNRRRRSVDWDEPTN